MNQRSMAAIVSLSCGAWLVASPALAQSYGRHMRSSGASRGFGVGSVGRTGYFGTRRSRLPQPAIPQAFGVVQAGYHPRSGGDPMFRWMVGGIPAGLQSATGFRQSLSYYRPVMGRGPFDSLTARAVGGPYFAPEPQGTAFHQFFGLKPAQGVEAAVQKPLAFDSLAEAIEQNNREVLRQTEARGLEIFKVAMARDAENRGEALAHAQTVLTALCDIDRQAYMPSLLLAHVALERNQLGLAVLHLARAVRRHPTVFIERPKLADYFPEPESLEEQMRRHLRIGDDNPTEAGAYALQAYCAWVLNDRGRVKHALERLAAVSQQAEYRPDPRANVIRFALAAATQ